MRYRSRVKGLGVVRAALLTVWPSRDRMPAMNSPIRKIRMDDGLWKVLHDEAKRLQCSRAEVIRQLLADRRGYAEMAKPSR